MDQESTGLAFVTYDGPAGKRGNKRARAIRVHAGKVGWLKSSKAAEVEARRKQTKPQSKKENRGDDCKHIELLAKPVAPVFGGLCLNTFDAAEDEISKRISYLMLSAVWPNVAGDSVAAPWFVDFCNDPLMFNTHCYAGAMYRDILAQKPEWSRGKVALTHKAKTLSIIKTEVGDLDNLCSDQIERLILSMGIMGVHEFHPKHVEHKPLPFKPFHPAANWITLWGRSDPVKAHVHASIALTQRLGGPKALRLPGLGYMCSLSDLFYASCYYCKPILDCYWDDVHIIDVIPEHLLQPWQESPCSLSSLPGAGFAKLPGGLPSLALSAFTELAYMDKIMTQPLTTCHPTNPVQRVRLATCHKLVSLPSWGELDSDASDAGQGTATSHRAIYEICRLMCVIYATACLVPLPPHNGWNRRHTTRAISLLEMANFEAWTSDAEGLYLWVLFIGGMAAYDTPNREWFENTLAGYATKTQMDIEYALDEARAFVWTDSVCEEGARELWDAAMTGGRAKTCSKPISKIEL